VPIFDRPRGHQKIIWGKVLRLVGGNPAASQKNPANEAGDPYGNRTRVPAVKGIFPLKTTAIPQLWGKFGFIDYNALAGMGEFLSSVGRSDRTAI
jgi:hypothetical protein